LEIERSLGRERVRKWGARIIDLDLILYGTDHRHTDLTIPHPLMPPARFVLARRTDRAGGAPIPSSTSRLADARDLHHD
jgi:2-amino-4-hydroxy-6-hydroxymethyldihydropteridine diphosphokinase